MMQTYPVVPYVPTPMPVARKMLELAKAGPGDVLYDLGAGDGRIVVMAVKEFGVSKAYGVELRHDLVEEARRKIREEGVEGKAVIVEADMFKVDIREASIVTLFLLTSVNRRLKPKLESELRPGTRIVSHEFQIPGWSPLISANIYDGVIMHSLYLYVR